MTFKYNELIDDIAYVVIKSDMDIIGQIRIKRGDKLYNGVVWAGSLTKFVYGETEFTCQYPDTIEKAAKILDAHHPGWELKVQNRFNMMLCDTCILGRLYGSHQIGMNKLFNINCILDYEGGPMWKYLTDSVFGTQASAADWIKEIDKRIKKEEPKVKTMNFQEAMQALNSGKKVRLSSWGPGSYWVKQGYIIVWDRIANRGEQVTEFLAMVDREWALFDERVKVDTLKPGDKFVYDCVTYIHANKSPEGIYAFCPAYNNVVDFPTTTLVTKV